MIVSEAKRSIQNALIMGCVVVFSMIPLQVSNPKKRSHMISSIVEVVVP